MRNQRREQPTDCDDVSDEQTGGVIRDDMDDDSPLVQRLRNLGWPQVTPGVRERCWREFQQMMASGEMPEAQADGDSSAS